MHCSSGGTSKADDARCAGKHGEGLKIAAAVAVREGLTLEIHQAGYMIKFADLALSVGYRVGTKGGDRDIQEVLRHLKRRKLTDRNSDVIQAVKGVEDPSGALAQFLLYSHREADSRAGGETAGRSYFRLGTPCGDVLWQGGSGDLVGCVYVCGIRWNRVEGQNRYGVDLPKGGSDNRNRDQVDRTRYQEAVAGMMDELLRDPSHSWFLEECLLEELENAQRVNDIPHLVGLGKGLSHEGCLALFDAFKKKRRLTGSHVYILTEEETLAEHMEHYLDPSIVVRTSRFLCELFRGVGLAEGPEEIRRQAVERLKALPTLDPVPWEASVKRILEEVFSPRCWEVLVLHDAAGEEDPSGTARCIRDPIDGRIHLSSLLHGPGDPPYRLVKALLEQWEMPKPKEEQLQPPPHPCVVDKPTEIRSWPDWRMRLHGSISDLVADVLVHCCDPRAIHLPQRITLGRFVCHCSMEGGRILAAHNQERLGVWLEEMAGHIDNVVGVLEWPEERPTPILCFTEEAVNGFCLLQETKVYVNLRPLLLPTPVVGWEAIVYVAAVLCHETAHLLSKEGHTPRHGRLTEDLLARVMLHMGGRGGH